MAMEVGRGRVRGISPIRVSPTETPWTPSICAVVLCWEVCIWQTLEKDRRGLTSGLMFFSGFLFRSMWLMWMIAKHPWGWLFSTWGAFLCKMMPWAFVIARCFLSVVLTNCALNLIFSLLFVAFWGCVAHLFPWHTAFYVSCHNLRWREVTDLGEPAEFYYFPSSVYTRYLHLPDSSPWYPDSPGTWQ